MLKNQRQLCHKLKGLAGASFIWVSCALFYQSIQEGQACISSIVCSAITLKFYNELMVLVTYERKKYSRTV